MKGARALCVVLSGLLPLSVAQLGSRTAQPPLEYVVKAAFLLNFTRFIEWPPNAYAAPNSPFAICTLGKDPFGAILDGVAKGETVNGRPLVVNRLDEPPAPGTCQIVFIAGARDPRKDLAALGPGILTVGESEEFERDGGMITFVVENRRVRFDVNLPAAQAVGLRLSSRLLGIARSVKR